MKTFALLAAVAVASVSAQNSPTNSTTTTTACDTTKLLPLLSDADLKQCSTDSGLTIPPPASISSEILTKACASSGCQGLLKKVLALNLGDCSIATFKIETDLINPLKKACGSSGSTAGSTSGTVTTAPSAGTGSSSSSTPATTTKAPTSVPSPTPTSGVASLTVAAGAIVAAIASSLL